MRKVAIPYAIRDGSIVHVSEVERGLQQDCHCPACDEALVARKGAKVAHHFAHQAKSECSAESALHLMGKKLFFERVENALSKREPVNISWDCVLCQERHEGNLVKKAVRVEMEMPLPGCRPDIVLLASPGSPVAFVEVVVSHEPESNVVEFCSDNDVVLTTYKVNLNVANQTDEAHRKFRLQRVLLEG